MRYAMPSPRGSNRAGLFLVERNPRGAYDAAIDPRDDPDPPRRFIEQRLGADDLAEYDRLCAAKAAKDADLAGSNGGRRADAATMARTDKLPGMDRAIRVAADAARREAIAEMNAIHDAEREVLPFVGKLRSRVATAAAVYKIALDSQGVDLKGVPSNAYRAILRNLPQQGARRSAPAASSSAPSIPGLGRIRLA